ncbi:MAG: 4-phosphopantetheinyl transferase [Chitinophagaceae bacterium]
MPIFFERDIDAFTKLAVWKIEENDAFFSSSVEVQRTITHPHKRLQHLAGRYLLRYLYADFPTELIQIADTRKPYLEDEAYHFSISHCDDFAAVIVSKKNRVGVDIEVVSDKIERIQHKFLNDQEKEIIHITNLITPIQLKTLIWSCKEAVFKWYGLGEVNFIKHIELAEICIADEMISTKVLFKKNEDLSLDLHSSFMADVCLSYVVS